MEKARFLNMVSQLYSAMNMADSDNPNRATWMHPDMVGLAGCAQLDKMLHNMIKCGALTTEELDTFHSELE